MSLSQRVRRSQAMRDDSGAALIVTLMVVLLLGILAGTVTTVSITNLQSSQQAQQAGVALNAADAGLSEGVSYLRTNGVSSLCAKPTAYTAETGVFNQAFNLATKTCVNSEQLGTPVAGRPYSVLIVTEVAQTARVSGRFAIYSTGFGAGEARRRVTASIASAGAGVPKGFFGRTVSGGGNITVSQSIFSTGCVYKRASITMTGIDGYGLPSAVHTSRIINDDQGTLPTCATSSKAIHRDGRACDRDGASGAPLYPFDQDALGGAFPIGSPCIAARASYPGITNDTWNTYYPSASGSKIADDATLFAQFGIKDPALTQLEIDNLRRIADRQGNLRFSSSSSDNFTPNGDEAVLFYDLSGGDVSLNTIKGFVPPATGCLNKSLIVVIVGGGAVFPSGDALSASIFVTTPGKAYRATGGKLVGSVYADLIDLGGNTAATQEQQDCSYSRPSPYTLEYRTTGYREIDR